MESTLTSWAWKSADTSSPKFQGELNKTEKAFYFDQDHSRRNYTQFAGADPQAPRLSYPIDPKIAVGSGDSMVGRCTFNTMGQNETTFLGQLMLLYE